MTNPDYLFILGASDPEMAAIENLLRDCGQMQIQAVVDGQRVHPGFAETMTSGATLVFVECGADPLPEGSIRVDHHRPGDPGYGRPPAEYWEASSIGQIFQLIAALGGDLSNPLTRCSGVRHYCLSPSMAEKERSAFLGDGEPFAGEVRKWFAIPAESLMMIAAADHCLAAAYRGQCPGVDPQALRAWRIESRAEFQGRSKEALTADIERAEAALRAAPRIEISGIEIADLRGPAIPELPEAATYLGLGYLAEVADRDGQRKIVISAGENTLREFMESWASAQGLTDIYGDPVRGFAGGYVQ